MKKIKRIIILFIVILLSGCSVEYNLTINNDLSVNEKVIAKEYTQRMNANTGLNTDQSVSYLYEMFDREGIKSKISSNTDNQSTTATVTASHNSLEDYAENFTSDVIEKVNYSVNENSITLKFNQSEILSSTSSKSLIYDNIKINVIVPFKVTDHNAKSVNRDKYTWEINKDQDLQEMKITFDKNDLKYGKRVSIGDKTYDIKYSYVILTVFLLIIAIIVGIVFVNNKKHNKI